MGLVCLFVALFFFGGVSGGGSLRNWGECLGLWFGWCLCCCSFVDVVVGLFGWLVGMLVGWLFFFFFFLLLFGLFIWKFG